MKHGLDELCTFYPFLKGVLQKAKTLLPEYWDSFSKIQANSSSVNEQSTKQEYSRSHPNKLGFNTTLHVALGKKLGSFRLWFLPP